YRAYEDMEVNKSNYRFYIDRDSLRSLDKAIRKNSNYRKQRNTWNQIRTVENYKYGDFLSYLPQDVASADLESMGYWEQQIDSIKNNYIASSVRAKENLGKRLLSFLNIASKELATSYNEASNLDNLLYIAILQTLVDEKNYDAYLNVLRYTVNKSEYGMALYYLEKMLKN